jgi:hypothetical protein
MATNRYSQNITIDWGDDVLYYIGVTVQLDQIMRRRTGQALVRAIQTRGLDLVIKPWPDRDTPGANTGSSSFQAARDATPDGQQMLTCGRGSSGNPVLRNGKPVLGTGQGGGAVISYSPNVSSQLRGAGNEPDEILLHEMAHAYRRMQGVHLCERTPNPLMASLVNKRSAEF